jgi:hypothetical protein
MNSTLDDIRSIQRRNAGSDKEIISSQNRMAGSLAEQSATTKELLTTNKAVLEEIKKRDVRRGP